MKRLHQNKKRVCIPIDEKSETNDENDEINGEITEKLETFDKNLAQDLNRMEIDDENLIRNPKFSIRFLCFSWNFLHLLF